MAKLTQRWPKLPKYVVVASVCAALVLAASLTDREPSTSGLNDVLLAAAAKEPNLFGSNAQCERDQAFWEAVNGSSLQAVLERQEGFKTIPLDQQHIVWFVPISSCFSGNRAGFMLFARVGDRYSYGETPITGDIKNVRMEGGNIAFDAVTAGGAENEYAYGYVYDGQTLQQQVVERTAY